jgi:hypothetical protein
MKLIPLFPLSKRAFAMVDDADFELVSQFKWYLKPAIKTSYAQRSMREPSGRFVAQSLHRFLLGVTHPKVLVDHRDRDGLNNRRNNLRVATRSQNGANQAKRPGLSSTLKGVCWRKQNRKWHAQIAVNGKKLHLGYFADEKDAAAAYRAAATKHFGPFMRAMKKGK